MYVQFSFLFSASLILSFPPSQSFWPDMFDYVSPSKVSKKSGATPAKPFLITETITPECAKEIYAYLFPLNEAKHRRRAYPPKGKKRFTILNGREPKAEFERALESLEGGAGEAFEVVRRRRRFSFKGAKSRYFYVDDGVREQELVRDTSFPLSGLPLRQADSSPFPDLHPRPQLWRDPLRLRPSRPYILLPVRR